MKIELIADEDNSFKLFGENSIKTQEIEQVLKPVQQPPTENAAPIENHRQTNTFDIFGGTPWAGNMQRPTDIGR